MTEVALVLVFGGIGPNIPTSTASNQNNLGGRVVALLCKGLDCFDDINFTASTCIALL